MEAGLKYYQMAAYTFMGKPSFPIMCSNATEQN